MHRARIDSIGRHMWNIAALKWSQKQEHLVARLGMAPGRVHRCIRGPGSIVESHSASKVVHKDTPRSGWLTFDVLVNVQFVLSHDECLRRTKMRSARPDTRNDNQ